MPLLTRLPFLLSLSIVVACRADDPGPSDPAPPPTAIGQWTATALDGALLPATAYEGPIYDDGGPARYRLLLDSSHVVLQANGRYDRTDWTTEQQNLDPAGSAPWVTVLRSQFDDFGTWSNTSGGVALESGFFQNLRADGSHEPTADRLSLFTGIDLDPLRRTVRYRRR
jgi:hypothetical protein